MSTDSKFGYNINRTQSEDKMATKNTGVEYWISDLCYVLDGEEWDELIALTERNPGPEYTLKGNRKVFMLPTFHGDGQYFDAESREYWVDSGFIGAIKVSDIVDEDKFTNATEMELGQRAVMPYDLSADNVTEYFGVLKFGEVIIDTSGGIEYLPTEDIDEETE